MQRNLLYAGEHGTVHIEFSADQPLDGTLLQGLEARLVSQSDDNIQTLQIIEKTRISRYVEEASTSFTAPSEPGTYGVVFSPRGQAEPLFLEQWFNVVTGDQKYVSEGGLNHYCRGCFLFCSRVRVTSAERWCNTRPTARRCRIYFD